MGRYKKLSNVLYSADLVTGVIDLNQTHRTICFLIVQHTNDREFICSQALQFLLANCRVFVFFGNHEELWHQGFEEVRSRLFPYQTPENTVLICGCSSFIDFVEKLTGELTTRSFIPYDIYLLYDDEEILEDVLRELKKRSLITSE